MHEVECSPARAALDVACRDAVGEEGELGPLCSLGRADLGLAQGHFDATPLLASLVTEAIGVIAGLGCEVVTGAETRGASTVACVAAGAAVATAFGPAVKRAFKK